MARSPSEEPRGLAYRPDVISAEEERELLIEPESLRWDPIVLHGRTARRSGRHFGLDYGLSGESRSPATRSRTGFWPGEHEQRGWLDFSRRRSLRSSCSGIRWGRGSGGTGTLLRSGRWSASRSGDPRGCGSSAGRARIVVCGTSSLSRGRVTCSTVSRARRGSIRSQPQRTCATRSLSGPCARPPPIRYTRR